MTKERCIELLTELYKGTIGNEQSFGMAELAEAVRMAIEAINFVSEYHQKTLEAYAHDMGVSLEQAERELRVEPNKDESGSVDSEMPEIKTDRTTSGDLIRRQAAIDEINALPKWNEDLFSSVCLDYADVISVLSDTEKLPSAQPERKKGKWIETKADEPCFYRCSECGRLMDEESRFCPNCGAEMRGAK